MDFNKMNGLIPAIIQDSSTKEVLMLGYMNQEAYEKTIADGLVCFYSRSKGRLWVKGESSGNYLHVVSIKMDCDGDTLLIAARPSGPVCHTGNDTCFDQSNAQNGIDFLSKLQQVIKKRSQEQDASSYTRKLFLKGIDRIVQKVGEEAVEVVIASKNSNDELLKEEIADLLYHLLVLLEFKSISLEEITNVLYERHQKPKH